VTVNLGGRHLATLTRLQAFARGCVAGALILTIAVVAGWLGGILTGGF
jgi:hypothetical protein